MSEGMSHDLTIGRSEFLKAARPLTHLLRRKDLGRVEEANTCAANSSTWRRRLSPLSASAGRISVTSSSGG